MKSIREIKANNRSNGAGTTPMKARRAQSVGAFAVLRIPYFFLMATLAAGDRTAKVGRPYPYLEWSKSWPSLAGVGTSS